LMGIPIEVAKEINKLIDDLEWHGFSIRLSQREF
jgi:hypothetical protein